MTPPNSPPQPPSRKNHYVPVWYQTGFQLNGADNWLLDLAAPSLKPDGTPVVLRPRRRPAKSSFWENELYVTRFGEVINDEVETVLFQKIDNFGSDAVRAFVAGDERAMHFQLESLLSYLGAQKLRTPKGLDWIKARYPALSQVELLIELQHLRNMFGTLWGECVREIVSAESSEVKFLVTDHPVTMFNAALPENASQFAYPMDPPLTWNGTQSLFALDANNLLILTHVPFAKDPDRVEAAAKRINARYFGNAMVRTDALIRTRRFNTDHVIAVNAWLKSRARRYVAAAETDWLYPEAHRQPERAAFAQLLRPPSGDLWGYGGEIYIGYEDGSHGYRDQYGRTSKDHEVVEKQPPSEPPMPDDDCPCGSGDTFGSCCEPLPIWERAPWTVLSLRERNLRFINALFNVLELAPDVPWTHVQRNLTDEQVARIHRLSQWLWPADTDLAALLPKRRSGGVRAIYMGLSDPRLLGENVAALCPVFDQVLVMDPFMFARNLRPDMSPVENPDQHKQQFLKNALFWIALAPLIQAGKVLIFPDPGEVNPDLRRAVFEMARARTADWEMEPAEYEEMRWLSEEDVRRAMKRMPDEFWLPKLKESSPGSSDAEAKKILEIMRRQQEQDPFALLQPAAEGRTAQLLMMRAVNLEIALFVAQITGAVIVTDITALWRHLHSHTRAGESGCDVGFEPLRFTASLHPAIAVQLTELTAATAVPSAINTLKTAINQRAGREDIERALDLVRSRLDALSVSIESMDMDLPRAQLTLTPSIPEAGFESPIAQRLVVSFGSDDVPVYVGLAFFRRTESGEAVRVVRPDADAPDAAL
ncbi:SEC-C metal-binding domain-containing protein [Noviluteimonas gilva]|uniref:DUF4238 domain-containing protein n=1 Tax=Noviluteimonas gilva TaxID=2682097 RepID=A0A7C9LK29_9GAMM|nr:SEC-C metal-binding domain-containing protein [Lysobacter gilvus]MUV15159.1 hypothetical protein [Lysobacter gilvus]